MINLKRILLIVSCALFFANVANSQNLISNGDFENDFFEWQKIANDNAKAFFTISTIDKKQGSKSFSVDIKVKGSNTWSIQLVHNKWNIDPKKLYHVSFYAKSSIVGSELKIINTDGTVFQKSYNLTTEWCKYEYLLATAEYTVDMKFQFISVGTYFIDDITIVEENMNISTPKSKSLKEASCGLYIGGAINLDAYRKDANYRNSFKNEFNMIVPENATKMGGIIGKENIFRFDEIDTLVNFATRNGILMRGHTFLWHRGNPKWLESKVWEKDELFAFLKTYIFTVTERYKGKIVEWDVANEFVGQDDINSLRKDSFWMRNLGEVVLDSAFKWAHQADPKAKLFYNDFWCETMDRKSDSVYALVKRLKDRGVPIHGVGLQFHYGYEVAPFYNSTFINEVDQNIKRYAALGLEVALTEIDLGIAKPFSPAKNYIQAQSLKNILQVAMNNRPTVKTVVFWGLTDNYSSVPIASKGKRGNALILDSLYQRKPAYNEFLNVLEKNCKK